jgi:AcrR family transcriptional regulator
MSARKKKPAGFVGRDPERTRLRILESALKEFAACGFAGARVGRIARRAKINKRMLYHYFEDKEGLFRAVLRHKISERRSSVEAQVSDLDPAACMSVWFKQNCLDTDWVRLLAWESLQTVSDKVVDEKERRRIASEAAVRIKKKQQAGSLRADVPAQFLQLARISLTMFPTALPQLTRVITGSSPHESKFQREYARFLETISAAFRP